MDENLKREIILDNYSNPYHKMVPSNKENYQKVNTNNSSCIDNLDIYVLEEDGVIKDICFEGEACAISTSSTSIMIKNLIGKTIDEALDYVNNFSNMLNEKEYDEELLNEGVAYNEIYKQNNRKHCAYLPYEGIIKVLNEVKEKK